MLALVWTAIYGATLQSRLFGDGPALLRIVLHEPPDYLWVHVAYIPLGKAFAGATAFATTAEALRWFSALCGALAVALVYPIARAYGARPIAAALATCLLAATPAQWFWSTTIELHPLHELAVTATAAATFALPWRRLSLALPIAALLTLSLHLTHQSGALLQPAFLVLAVHAHERAVGTRASRRLVVRAFVPAYGLALCAAIAVGRLLKGGPGLGEPGGLLDLILELQLSLQWDNLWSMWGWPLGIVWSAPFLLFAARESRTAARIGLVAALASVPAMAFFTWFGFPERGAYALGFLPFWAAGAGVALDRLVRPIPALAVAAAVVLAVQVALGLASMRDPGAEEWALRHRSRCEFVDGLSDGPTFVLSFDTTAQAIESETDDVREFDMLNGLRGATASGLPDDSIRTYWDAILGAALAVPDACVVFDLGHRGLLAGTPELQHGTEVVEEHTRATYPHETLTHDGVEYLLLRPR